MGPQLNSPGAEVISASGKTVIPGLIDAHTHLRSVPGAYYRNESDEQTRKQQIQQLKAYLVVGVTTVLDAAAPASLFQELHDVQKDHSIPRVKGLAPFLTPAGGYFSGPDSRGRWFQDLWKPIESREDVIQSLRQAMPLHSLGAKVTVESGFGPFQIWPIFSREMREAIVKESQQAGLPLFVHSESEEAFEVALEFSPYAFMHGGFYEDLPSQKILKRIKESGAYVVSTLAIFKMMQLLWDQDLLNDPWLRTLVPEVQIATAKDTKIRTQVVQNVCIQNKPKYAPKALAKVASEFFFSSSTVKKNLANSQEAMSRMYQAGIPIVMGSDAGNWPVFSTFFHGVGSILEMEALQEAGIPVLEVIRSATSRAAQMLKMDDQVGRIEVGKIADMIILKRDPMSSKEAFRDLEFVIKDGKVRRPQDWLLP
jgi:imidazolonepropionase-like amidohydrolase